MDSDPTGLVPWLLGYIAATESPEALWFIADVIKGDKEAGEPYLTDKALRSLREAVRLQRDKLAEAEHRQNIESRANLPSDVTT